MFGLLGGTRMFLPEKIVSTIKKPEAAEVVAVDIKEGKMSTVKNQEPEVLTVYIKDLRAISMLISGTMKFLSEMTGRIIKKMEAEVVSVDIKDLKAVLHTFVGTMKFLLEKIGSIIKMSEAKVVAAATDIKEMMDIFMSLGGTMKFLLETVGSMIIKNPAACVDIKNLKAMCELFVGTIKFFLEKMGRGITMPTAAVVGLEIKDLNRDGVTYNAKVAVSNPFIVPIPIGQISYTLKSDDRFHFHPFPTLLPKFVHFMEKIP